MNKLTIAAAALFLASTAAAHAGNSISFQIDGQHIRIETPRNCASLDCVTIVAPGLSNKPIRLNNINLNGLGGSKDDDVDTTPAPAHDHAAPRRLRCSGTNSPIGVWATEENKGNVRVEQCGPNLCGYAQKTNERILINMKPDGAKWSGRIHDPDSGRNYDSTIAMKGPNAMRVQGCAFGGMFCGGQTWKRVS
ncbi:DUF2147 domain-containing protein [Bradyrhizobium sp. SEMIA]|uniref:DUF2147 domain-containing protein n=1 Tax=Bradyrhizobium sp. SEMIA TaxID=2597515 RepID=UPI0018A4188B|nr:DUF2147 domain-containing protein [Bradyrhizobium sp. SEMIA]QOG16919.1 DUF2147 domain-containing protein [Bradyrhizobium sp. SEMIA]